MTIKLVDPYIELKRLDRQLYQMAIMYSETLAINNKLELKIAADVERYFIHFALDVLKGNRIGLDD